jgi:hypothetical protein
VRGHESADVGGRSASRRWRRQGQFHPPHTARRGTGGGRVRWREAPFFSERERAALHWAEVVNAMPLKGPSDADFAQLQAHFTDNEIAELGYAIAVIKGWNVLNLSLRNQIPETPAPGF